jgi:hypothetical protein
MEPIEELEESFMKGGGKDSFFSYMFSLSSTEKSELINLFQYILLIIIPVTILLKLMKTYIPLDNPKKASIEIIIEVVLQLVIIFSVFWFIHKMIMFIPTYSGTPYPRLNIIQLVIPVFFLLICMKTSISEKVSILLERVLIALGLMKEVDDEEEEKSKKKNNNVNTMLPQQTNFMPPPMNTVRDNNPQQNMNFQQSMDMAPPPYSMAGGYGLQEPMASNEAGVTFLNF